jgi:hypothetical protein
VVTLRPPRSVPLGMEAVVVAVAGALDLRNHPLGDVLRGVLP